MAKIYETEKDVKYDELERKAEKAGFIYSISTLVAGAGLGALGNYVFFRKPTPETKALLNENKILAGFTGLVGLATAVFSYRQVKQASAEARKLGPQEATIHPAQAQDYINTKVDHAQQILAQQTATQNNALGL